MSKLFKLFIVLLLLLPAANILAAECKSFFPGSTTFAVNGAHVISSSNRCNNGACTAIQRFSPVPVLPPIAASTPFALTNVTDGKYEFTNWGHSEEAEVSFSGAGTAVIYFSETVVIDKETEINIDGNPENILIIVNGNLIINEETQINGHIYVAGSVSIRKDTKINGALSVADALTVDRDGLFTYKASDVEKLNAHGFCESPVPAPVTVLADYRFDECAYIGQVGEVVDQTGNFNADAKNSALDKSNRVINHALDLTDDGVNDWLQLPNGTVNGLNDLSLAFWVNTSVSKTQQTLLHALGNDVNDDELEVFIRNNNQVQIKIRDNAQFLTSTISLTNGQWHHMVVTRQNDTICLFVDGNLQECKTGALTGELSVTHANAVVIGQEQDSYGGSFTTSQNFVGRLDEFKIYQGALSTSQISTIHSNESSGLNYSGSARDAIVCQPPFSALYEFEDTDFDFSNDVEDSNGLLGGTNLGGLSTENGKYCRAFDSNGVNTSAATGNAFKTGVTLPAGYTKGTVSFWFNSHVDWATGGQRTLFDASNYNALLARIFGERVNSNFVLKLDSDGTLKFSVESRATFITNDIEYITQEAAGAGRLANQWYYITTTWDYDNGQFQLFVNGTRVANTQPGRSISFPSRLDKIIIGDNASLNVGTGDEPSPNSANGKFDNVKIYDIVLTNDQIITDMQGVDCKSDPIFQFSHDGNGITCLPEKVDVIACTDASCTSTNVDVNTTIDMLVNGGASQTVTIVNGIGSTNFNYTDTTTPAIISSTADYLCTNTSLAASLGKTAADCGLNFTNSGLVISHIGNQISGEDFSVSPNEITIQAVQADEAGACRALFNGTTGVGLAMQYQMPVTTTSNNYTINGTSIIKSTSAPSSYTSINLTFDNEGKAKLPINNYEDAGKIRLHAQIIIPATTELAAVTLTNSSNDFWVRPYYLTMSAIIGTQELNATTATSTVKHVAGNNFNFNITAVNKNGQPTYNYSPTKLQFKLTRIGPSSGGVEGKLVYGETLGAGPNILSSTSPSSFADATGISFSSGSYTYNKASYNEVGLIRLAVQDVNYGNQPVGSELVVPGGVYDTGPPAVSLPDMPIGRFIPAFLKQSVVVVNDSADPSLNVNHHGTLTGEWGNWAYSGHNLGLSLGLHRGAIKYQQPPKMTITAYNAQNVITQNYIDEFMKLEVDGINITPPSQDSQTGAKGTPILLEISNVITGSTLTSTTGGIVEYQLNVLDNFTYEHSDNSLLIPFQPDLTITVNSVTDKDDVNTCLPRDYDNANKLCSVLTFTENIKPLPFVESSKSFEIRFGRLNIDNSFGPATSNLPQRFYVEYFNKDSEFIVNEDDLRTELEPTKVTLSDISLDHNLTNTLGSKGLLINGVFNDFSLLAPHIKGQLNVEYLTPTWLQFNWLNTDVPMDGNLQDDNAKAIATFGRYRGNDRVIYWKEVND